MATVPQQSNYIYQISGNSPYDPDYTSVGSVSNSWTTLTTLFNKYMCTYSKVKIIAQPIDAATQRINMTVCKRSVTSLSVPLALSNAIAQPDCVNRWNFNNGTSNNAKMTVISRGSTPRILGRKIDPSLDRVAINDDPQEEWTHILQLWNSNIISTNVYLTFYVTYWCTMSDPKLASTT